MSITTEKNRLEPRVASLETELRVVVKAVGDLTKAFDRVETQIQSLALMVERVGAPKQANWLALIATAVSVTLLFVTLGGLVLLPMGKEITRLQAWSDHHGNLELHPVGKTRIDALERELRERWIIDSAGLDKIFDRTEKVLNRLIVLETKLQATP